MNHTHRSPTIADVAKRAGVSIATVSRVLNDTAPVEAVTIEKVHTAIRELHYTPRAAARVLASRRTGTIGLLLPEIGGDFFSPLLRGIETGARQMGYDLLIHCTRDVHTENTLPARLLRRPLGEHNTDGLIVFADSLDMRELMRLHTIGFPVVLLHQTPPEEMKIPVITVENKAGAYQLTRHLIEAHGRRRIVFLRGPEEHEDSAWRECGYREALERNGLSFEARLLGSGGFSEAMAYEAVRKLIREEIAFDAIFAGNDDAAYGALQALLEANRRVPEEVSLVGFDDLPFSRFMMPPLTTVRAPIERVGLEGVRLLSRIMRGEAVELKVLLPTEVVIRESCGCLSK